MAVPDFQIAVLGSGPVGIVAALELSKHYRTALITHQLPSADQVPRVEAVPASLLALLIEYGIHPRRVGVDRLHETRLIAWENNNFGKSIGPAAAHVERPALDLALLDALIISRRVKIILSQKSASLEAVDGLRQQSLRVIDATGRRSLTATTKIHPAKPWVGRIFLTSTKACSATREFRIAALPGGFAYRLATIRSINLGIVGRGKMLGGDPEEIERHLHEYEAGWVLEGLPPMADMIPGRVSPASVQWAGGNVSRRIGDAALARDTLSSQGLACGISDALFAAGVRDDQGETRLSRRQFEQRLSHLASLANLIARCRFRDHDAWKEYEEFISDHLVRQTTGVKC
jgi:flavin-dependent dehydrogenase